MFSVKPLISPNRAEIGSRIAFSVHLGNASPNAPKAVTTHPVNVTPSDDARARNQMRAMRARPPTSSAAPAKLIDECAWAADSRAYASETTYQAEGTSSVVAKRTPTWVGPRFFGGKGIADSGLPSEFSSRLVPSASPFAAADWASPFERALGTAGAEEEGVSEIVAVACCAFRESPKAESALKADSAPNTESGPNAERVPAEVVLSYVPPMSREGAKATVASLLSKMLATPPVVGTPSVSTSASALLRLVRTG